MRLFGLEILLKGTSDLYLVMCRTGTKESKGAGVTCLVIPKDSPGLTFGANEKKMGCVNILRK